MFVEEHPAGVAASLVDLEIEVAFRGRERVRAGVVAAAPVHRATVVSSAGNRES